MKITNKVDILNMVSWCHILPNIIREETVWTRTNAGRFSSKQRSAECNESEFPGFSKDIGGSEIIYSQSLARPSMST